MKKSIYGAAFALIASSFLLVACTKQDASQKTVPAQAETGAEKSGILTDVQLIAIINGYDPSYTRIGEIEELLFDNSQLSSSVIRTLIANTRFPDYIVEEMMVLSAPIAPADLAYLHALRPSVVSTTIVAASNLDVGNADFAIFNTSPRQLFIAKNLIQKPLCSNACGESEWKGTDFSILHLTSATTPLEPSDIIACDFGKWVCGKATESTIILSDGETTIVVTKCEGKTTQCVRKAAPNKMKFH